jgi:hypothetical protein
MRGAILTVASLILLNLIIHGWIGTSRLKSIDDKLERQEQRLTLDAPIVMRFEGKTAVEAAEKYAFWQNNQKKNIVSVTSLSDANGHVMVVTFYH